MQFLFLILLLVSIPLNAVPLLFSRYPALQEKIPYCALGDFPTPVHPLKNLSNHLHAHLYMKRDDLAGAKRADGSHAYGGNKVRKLEFLLAQALAQGAKTVMTFGCAGSNHAVATSIYANSLGLHCAALLKPQANARNVQKNLLRHQQYGTQLHYYDSHEARERGAKKVYEELTTHDGTPPYIIPTGGSNPYGALGFVNAAFELDKQIKVGLLPEPHAIYVACGSCGTVAGLLLGCTLAGISSTVVCVAVEPEEVAGELEKTIQKIFYETNNLLHVHEPSIPRQPYPAERIIITHEYAGVEYGVFTQEGTEACNLMDEQERIVLDGTYTAKACAAFLNDIKRYKKAPILFWNTFCGFETETIEHRTYTQLPHSLQQYFQSSTQEENAL